MPVDLTIDAGVAELVLNRPPLNVVNTAMYDEFDRLLREAADSPDVRVLLLRSAADRAFSAGADLRESGSVLDGDPAERRERVGAILRALRHFPVPTVVASHGYALGLGMVLAACCDIRIAADDTQFAMAEIKHGVFGGAAVLTGSGLTETMRHWLVQSGERMDAVTALRAGFVNEVVPRAELLERARAAATVIAAGSREVLAANKKFFVQQRDAILEPALALETEIAAQLKSATTVLPAPA